MPDFRTPLITAIIPVRLSKDQLYDEPERIRRIIATLPAAYVPLIVDYGTPSERKDELSAISHETGTKLVRVETGREPFSIGRARDIGTQHATTPLVVYHDIDFLLSRESYERVIYEARLRGMPENAYQFFAIPGAYLTEEFTKKYLDLHSDGDGTFADLMVHDGVMRNDKTVFSVNTYAISAIVANRYHLLAIGGHDQSFAGHGAEDFELMHRLTSYNHRGPRTRDYYKNTRNNSIQSYEGFRAYYALYGIDVFQRGIIISHLWHPRRMDFGYVGTDNQSRVSRIMQDYDKGHTSLPPLMDETSSEYTLALIRPGTSPARSLRHVLPALGRFKCIPDDQFEDGDSLLNFVRDEGISRILFLNPYGNEHRLSLYRATRASGVRFVTYDRGSLNDSWFFDPKGFLADSESYAPEYWDKPLDTEDRDRTLQFIDQMRLSNETLEKNGYRIGAEHLRQSLGVGDRKVVFVALQRPSDTATVYFSGPCQNAAEFNNWIAHMAAGIDPRRYVVVAKKHPLETERPNIPGVVFVDDNTHINDLIDLANKVVVINSGTGIIAAAYGKPVICCGDSFYAHRGIAQSAISAGQLLTMAQSDIPRDEERVIRFLKYLIFDFYSFGKAEYIEKIQDDGSLRRVSRKTVYSVIRGLSEQPIHLGPPPSGVSLDAPLFYSFGGRTGITGKPAKASSSPANAVTTSPAEKLAPTGLRAATMVIVRPFVARIGNKQDVRDFNADPAAFFANLKNPWYRGIGAILFPR
ncbi:putative glycosyltransferase involved in capsule biosynthesis [Rhizobium petrolearium]|uniref:Capsular biosynthesis protein n=1 Tax=Neorhizobium petrolearium TaxID=515361 RepID=A0ABY8LVD4_9HYPH|nr:capsular biosynthesis protein [Neorhizobium petrolearium]MBP1848526.1 putative glycosyltransferase involved in capsule biosynthesis [Neorhizobium petrolearium]MCC2611069.1 capsular biosynthesis protein [Neorhizobium petrolearium]WGI66286.1 capsular biosynthesis protein [Neorhizobium petrolearium]